MQFQEQTLILKNPDGSIQFAVQPHIKGKKSIECYKCKSLLIYEGQVSCVKCTKCNTVNGIPGQMNQANKQMMCASCGTHNNIVTIEGGQVAVCRRCGTLTGIV